MKMRSNSSSRLGPNLGPKLGPNTGSKLGPNKGPKREDDGPKVQSGPRSGIHGLTNGPGRPDTKKMAKKNSTSRLGPNTGPKLGPNTGPKLENNGSRSGIHGLPIGPGRPDTQKMANPCNFFKNTQNSEQVLNTQKHSNVDFALNIEQTINFKSNDDILQLLKTHPDFERIPPDQLQPFVAAILSGDSHDISFQKS